MFVPRETPHLGRNLDVLQFFFHVVQEAVQHFCIQHEVVLGRLRLFRWLLTRMCAPSWLKNDGKKEPGPCC